MRDLLVVGGGPIGLATALYAARAGLDVVVREQRPGPVDKACGEGLMPGAVADLAALGVHPEGHAIAGIRYRDETHAVEAPFRSGPGRGVRRTTLHAALSDAVAAAGVEVEERTVGTLVQHDDRVVIDGDPVRHVIAADGLHSPVRRRLGLDAPTSDRRRYGLRCHVRLAPWTDFVDVHWADGAEAYVTPVADDLVGIAVLAHRREGFASLLGGFPALRARIGAAETTKVRGAGPLRQGSTRRVAGRVLLVGDAAGYVDALTGEGIALGLGQARAAVRAIATGTPQRYEAAYRRLGWRHDLLTHALLRATGSPVVRRRVVPAAAALPRLFGAAVDQLARPV